MHEYQENIRAFIYKIVAPSKNVYAKFCMTYLYMYIEDHAACRLHDLLFFYSLPVSEIQWLIAVAKGGQ